MGRKGFPGGAVLAPVPPVLVTVSDGEATNVLTVGWCGILATTPPKTYVSIRPSRYSYEILKRGGEFVINLATASMAREVDYIGIYTGKKVDKFKKCNLTLTKSENVAPPTIEECPIAIECRVTDILPMGTHDVFVADVVGFTADEEIIDESGRLDFKTADLLAYAHGEYFALGERLGSFGFSTKPRGSEKGKNSPKKSLSSEGKGPTADAQGSGKSGVKGNGNGSGKNAPKTGKKGLENGKKSAPKGGNFGAKSAKESVEKAVKNGKISPESTTKNEQKPFYADFIKRGKKRR